MKLSIVTVPAGTELDEMTPQELIDHAVSTALEGPINTIVVIGENFGSETLRGIPHVVAMNGVGLLWQDVIPK